MSRIHWPHKYPLIKVSKSAIQPGKVTFIKQLFVILLIISIEFEERRKI